MNRRLIAGLVSAALVAAGIGGFWTKRSSPDASPAGAAGVVTPDVARAADGPVIYYQDPDGKPLYSGAPAMTADGRPYRAVRAGEDVSFETPTTAARAPGSTTRKILYYRNPMGLPDVSPTPKKDSMGMDYIAVYEDEDGGDPTVKINPGRLQTLGVAVELVTRQAISEPVRAPGTIQLDERRVFVISLRVESFVDSVENVTTGSIVRKGQPLMRLYSPVVAAAAADYLSSLMMRPDASALRGTRLRLLNLAVPQELLSQIETTREVPLTFAWPMPRDGIVLERNVVEGMRVNPGDVLFRLADYSVVWALVDVAERDLASISQGQTVAVKVRSFPDRQFPGKVALIYPQLNPATRTVRVRIELANPDFLLRSDMYAEAEIDIGKADAVLTVPESAIIDSGNRQIVIVEKGKGKFEPRPVKLGRKGAGLVEIREGVEEGETVVTSANFLIDAESNLKAALKGLNNAGVPQ